MTRRISLSRGLFAIIDDNDFDRVSAKRWYAKPCRKRDEGWYAATSPYGGQGTLYLHRFIVSAEHGQVVDHINGDGLDNRRANLRVGDLSLNAINRRYENPTGFRGVHRVGKNTYRARITVRGRPIRSGGFQSAEDAARAYDELALVHHGRAAILNFDGRDNPIRPPKERSAA